MIVIDCTVDDKDLTLEQLQEQFEVIKRMAYPDFEYFPIVSIKCYPDEIWITQWQQDNIFTGEPLLMGGPWKSFRDVPLRVKA